MDRVNEKAGRDLPAAITVGVLLLAWLVLSLVYFMPGFVAMIVIGAGLGSIELHRALEVHGRGRSAIVPIVIGGALTNIGAYFVAGHRAEDAILFVGAPISLTVAVALAWRLRRGPADYVKDASASLFTVAYAGLLPFFLPLAAGEDRGPLRILAMIMCIVGSDTGGYIAGVLFGKHKMAPVISPKKTWEGFAGSVLLSAAFAFLTVHVLLGAPVWAALVFGLAMVVTGTLGDLVESMIKRDIGIKDMSGFLPGHGGVLDRVDSILFSAPLAWLLLYLLVPGV